jgi:hypothetical protein
MKKLFWLAAAALAATFSTAAPAQKAGDWVLAQWQGGAFWFPGVVQAHRGNMVTIRYDDGTLETRPENQVRPYDWHVGSRVSCRFTDGHWYAADILALDPGGLTIRIRYIDDGVLQTTQTGRCRTE